MPTTLSTAKIHNLLKFKMLHKNHPASTSLPPDQHPRSGTFTYTARDSKMGSAGIEQPLHLRPACINKLFNLSFGFVLL
jgi:hypothetical protein